MTIKITTYTLNDEGLESNDWRSAVVHKIVGMGSDIALEFRDGEMEDNSVSRNFDDVNKFPFIVAAAVNSGKQVVLETVEVSDVSELPNK